MFIVRPDRTGGWNMLLKLEDLLAHPEFDASALEWEPSSIPVEDRLVRAALASGVACSTGIVIDGGLPADIYNLQELLKIQREAPGLKVGLSQAEGLMEAIAPGWKAHAAELDSRIETSLTETIERRRASIERHGQAAFKRELVQHWAKLGGAPPSPE